MKSEPVAKIFRSVACVEDLWMFMDQKPGLLIVLYIMKSHMKNIIITCGIFYSVIIGQDSPILITEFVSSSMLSMQS